MVTVQQMIDSLKKYPQDAPVYIDIMQYNQRYPVASCEPNESTMVDNSFATMRDGVSVKISVSLPSSGDRFMITQTRKKN